MNGKKYSAGALEARKGLENAQQEFDAARVEALGLVRDQLKKIQTSAQQYELYRDKILPVARQTVEASRSAYEASTGGFLELITTRRTLQDVESAALNHLADYEAAIAELDAIIGGTRPDRPSGNLKMKSISIYLLCLLLAVAFAPSCSKPTNPAEKTLYTCGMHPQVVQDHPGDCPICGLKLEPVRKQPSPTSKVSGKDAGPRKIEY